MSLLKDTVSDYELVVIVVDKKRRKNHCFWTKINPTCTRSDFLV